MVKSFLSERDKLMIVEHKAKNWKISEISKKIKRNESTVRTFLKAYKARKSLKNRKSTGRPRKITPKQRRRLIRHVKKNRRQDIETIRENIDFTHVTGRTINNELLQVGLKSYKPTKKPKITKAQKKKRVEWAKKHSNLTTDEWEKWIFSDESYFTIQYEGGQRVRRESGEGLLPECLSESTKWASKIMFWGAFFFNGVSELIFIDGTMNSERYIQILQEGLLSLFRRHRMDKNAYVFQEDGDPKHQSHQTKYWKKKEGLNFIENWPPNSPDLNPIENLWSILKRRVGALKPTTVDQAKQYLRQEWRRLEADGELTQFIHSMPKRCQEVLRMKGQPTKY